MEICGDQDSSMVGCQSDAGLPVANVWPLLNSAQQQGLLPSHLPSIPDPKLINLLKILPIQYISTLFDRRFSLWCLQPFCRSSPSCSWNSPPKNSPFRYAAHIQSFCWPDDNCRLWQVLNNLFHSIGGLALGAPLPGGAGLRFLGRKSWGWSAIIRCARSMKNKFLKKLVRSCFPSDGWLWEKETFFWVKLEDWFQLIILDRRRWATAWSRIGLKNYYF
jgi:hypothetical protein